MRTSKRKMKWLSMNKFGPIEWDRQRSRVKKLGFVSVGIICAQGAAVADQAGLGKTVEITTV
jgi:hypothetical protein